MKKIVIVGGVAGGASAATRARRIDETAQITVIERGSYVSFANCGLPYHLGSVIKDRENLIIQTPETLKARFNIDVLTGHEASGINRKNKSLKLKDLKSGKESEIKYDKLILSPGAEPFKPPIKGLDNDGVFTFRTIPEMDSVISHIKRNGSKSTVVIGGGFIGIEVAENLRHKGLAVTLIEAAPQIMPHIDREMAALLHQHMRFHGVDLKLSAKVSEISKESKRLTIHFKDLTPIETDLVIFAAGIRPETLLARESGIEVGPTGGIRVDKFMQTSDPDVYAVGDAAETFHRIGGEPTLMALAGPANKQGRIAADNSLRGNEKVWQGAMGTWICKVFDLVCAQTGYSERALKSLNRNCSKIYTHPANHAGYYPGAFPMSIKLIYDSNSGQILGAQIIGNDGVDKRIDVLATAIAGKLNVEQLADLELAYAPPFGSAKDPVNMAGMIAQNIKAGLHPAITVDEFDRMSPESFYLLDVRTEEEHQNGHIPGSARIEIDSLRNRMSELPKDREIILYCQVGLRGYLAARILLQNGIKARNLLGGYKTWCMFHEEVLRFDPEPKPLTENFCSTPKKSEIPSHVAELDACGLQCPGPLIRMKKKIDELSEGQYLRIVATDPGFPPDAAAWCRRSGNRLAESFPQDGHYVVIIEKTQQAMPVCTDGNQVAVKGNKFTMVVFSNDFDRAMATFIIANGAAAMGFEVTLFFTFWGLNILRKSDSPTIEKTFMEKMYGMMMPKGPDALGLSKMHFAGMGTAMMKRTMNQKNVTPLPELIDTARASGVKLVACTMTMDIMGIKKEELIDGVVDGGVASYIDSAASSTTNLFI